MPPGNKSQSDLEKFLEVTKLLCFLAKFQRMIVGLLKTHLSLQQFTIVNINLLLDMKPKCYMKTTGYILH